MKAVAKRATTPKREPVAAPVKDNTVARERVLRAAAHLFRERGYQGTTVRDIAQAVGILSGSLFHHFRSKEEMLLEIMREAALSVCVRAEEILAHDANPTGRLRELISMELHAVLSDPRKDYHGVLFFEWREVPPALRSEFTVLRKRYRRSWLEVLRSCQAQGLLRCEPDAAALILHGALSNAMTWFTPAGRYSAKAYGDILAHLVLN